jgi:hypothetical protein
VRSFHFRLAVAPVVYGLRRFPSGCAAAEP